jgi:hypothetical protein
MEPSTDYANIPPEPAELPRVAAREEGLEADLKSPALPGQLADAPAQPLPLPGRALRGYVGS